jgi:hypothetical protein
MCAALRAFAVSGPLIVLVAAGQIVGSETSAHATAFVAIILGLPWVVPSLVVIAVLSAPIYVALHIAGYPQDLMPWLSGVILIAGLVACHVNAMLLLHRLGRRPAVALDGGLADFLRRSATRTA